MKYVNLKIAKKLSKIGFNENCQRFFTENGEIFDAPTIDEALDWLRRAKNIFIDIITIATFSSGNKIGYLWQIKTESDGSKINTIEAPEIYIHLNECKRNALETALEIKCNI